MSLFGWAVAVLVLAAVIVAVAAVVALNEEWRNYKIRSGEQVVYARQLAEARLLALRRREQYEKIAQAMTEYLIVSVLASRLMGTRALEVEILKRERMRG
ncbi:hypothetical protein [Streptomyces goshikiensis]|uniref:hypothetical protein n=1 Tax=Streptomyces goshikiensis TaxID=1942 RepID=UPI0033B5207B